MKKTDRVLLFLIILTLVFIGIFSYRCGWQWIDSDHASEMILGKLLAEENALVSTKWRYSTELRLIYQTIFTMPLFKIFGHLENWALIRALNIVLNNIVLLAAYYFLMNNLRVKLKWILLTSMFLILPLNYEYWNIVTFGGYYIFFIAQSFCCIGLFLKLAAFPDYKDVFKNAVSVSVLYLILSFILGVQGIRAVYGIFLPLLVTCLIIKKKNIIIYACAGFTGCCAGYLVNILLNKKFSFIDYQTMQIDNTANFFSKFGQCLVNLAGFFGIASGSKVMSPHGAFSIAAIIGTLILFWAVLKTVKKQRINSLQSSSQVEPSYFMSLFFIVSVIVHIFVFIVSDKSISARYFIPFMIFYVPLVAILFEYSESHKEKAKRIAVICGILLFVFGKGALNFFSFSYRNTNSSRLAGMQYLLDNNLKFGFATFWNANVLTELSNGAIGMLAIENARGRTRPYRAYNHLVRQQYLDPSFYKGESFILFTRSEWEMFSNRSRSSSRLKPDYEDDNFVIVRYPSAKEIHQNLLEQ